MVKEFAAIVKQAHDGDERAMKGVIDALRSPIGYWTAALIDKDRGAFEVAIMRAVQKMDSQKMDKYRTDAHLFNYFGMVLKNTFNKLFAAQNAKSAAVTVLRDDELNDGQDYFDEKEFEIYLRQIVCPLSERQKEIVWLKIVEDRTDSEIAEELGVSEQAVQQSKTLAYKPLRNGYIDRNDLYKL